MIIMLIYSFLLVFTNIIGFICIYFYLDVFKIFEKLTTDFKQI